MKRFHWVSISFALIACAATVQPKAVLAETTTATRRAAMALDVSLHKDGVLVGQVVNPQGQKQVGVEVLLTKNGQTIGRGVTDGAGLFGVSGVVPGQYALATSNGQVAVRAWNSAVAPPSVAVGALLVDGDVARAQCNCNGSAHAGHGQQYVTVHEPAHVHVPAPAAPVHVPAPAYNGTFVSDPSATYAGSASGGYTSASCQTGASHYRHRGVAGGRRGLLGFGILGGNGAGTIGAAPILAGGAVAAAVAIPVALDDDDDDDAS